MSKVGCPIRKSTDRRLFAPPRSLSQRTTSFIASYRQGIHQMPLSHLIALISNAHLAMKCETALEKQFTLHGTRHDGHCQRPEVIEINPDRSCGQHLRLLRATKGACTPDVSGLSPLYDVEITARPEPSRMGVLSFTDAEEPRFVPKFMVEPDGIEPPTSCLQSRRSPS
jgi:hypothetical protein